MTNVRGVIKAVLKERRKIDQNVPLDIINRWSTIAGLKSLYWIGEVDSDCI